MNKNIMSEIVHVSVDDPVEAEGPFALGAAAGAIDDCGADVESTTGVAAGLAFPVGAPPPPDDVGTIVGADVGAVPGIVTHEVETRS
jgi:hypothetical protein